MLGPYVDGLSRLAVASYKVKYLCAFPHHGNVEQNVLQDILHCNVIIALL